MSGTVLDNPLVHDYLRKLDAACARLPAEQARELREQITAHLDEALPPQASDAEVNAELGRLGTPYSLAAEAAGPAPRSATRKLLTRLSRLRWWAWALIGAAAVVIATAATYLIVVNSVAPLQLPEADFSAWWFPQDTTRSVVSSAAGVNQFTVPERSGQQQGFVVAIANNSDWMQTILGPADDWRMSLGSPEQFAVGSGRTADRGVGWSSQSRWDLPGSIPPHSVRLLRVLWKSELCLTPRAGTFIRAVTLRVRVGLVTRTEDIQLRTAFALSGNKASSC